MRIILCCFSGELLTYEVYIRVGRDFVSLSVKTDEVICMAVRNFVSQRHILLSIGNGTVVLPCQGELSALSGLRGPHHSIV